MLRSSNSIVMDLLLVSEAYDSTGTKDDEFLTQQQYDEHVYKSYKGNRMGSNPTAIPQHPVYDVIYEVELMTKDTKGRRKYDLIVKCPRRRSLSGPSRQEPASPATSRTDAVSYEELPLLF